VPVRILIDGGSEHSYITTQLELKGEAEFETFGTEHSQRGRCDLVEIILKGRDESDIVIHALTFPTICAPSTSMVNPHQFF